MNQREKLFGLTCEAIDDLYSSKQIPKYPNYKIDRFGIVYDKNDEVLKTYHYDDDEHYDCVHLRDPDGKSHVVGVHVLVSMTYDPEFYPGCIVHHKNENKYDNIDLNLEVTNRSDHARLHKCRFKNMEMACSVCGKRFVWTDQAQQRYYSDLRRNIDRIITCSRKCSGFYARMKQLGRI